MNSAVVFQGQGSYSTIYTRELLKKNTQLDSYLQIAEEILGWSPREIIFRLDNVGGLTTDYAQPLIFLMEYMGWAAYKVQLTEQPEYLAGHSLGEFTALTVSGVIPFEQAVELVKMRGKLMQESGSDIPQGMLTVFGCSAREAEELCEEASVNTGSQVYCANYNGHSHIVLSGAKTALNYIASKGKVKCIPLQVTKAFHTAYMREAAEKFKEYLKTAEIGKMKIPVISNVTARPYQASWSIRDILYRQIFSPVRWCESIDYMKARGIDSFFQVSDSPLFQSMDRNSATMVLWGSLEGWIMGRYYDYNGLYPASKRKASYRPDIVGEILSCMIEDPWEKGTDIQNVKKAACIYEDTSGLFNNNEPSCQDLMKAMNNLEEILVLKGFSCNQAKERADKILNKYGIYW